MRIEVDNQMNASAGFDAGMFKLVRNRLVLTIGVPLVAGLDTSQFAGVLAHEFGHFTQGAGLRVTYIVRSINFWFVRVVYERDAWDQWLEETASELDFRIGWILQLARVAVFLSRRILWFLMMIGHIVSGFMMRQMEYHADAHEGGWLVQPCSNRRRVSSHASTCRIRQHSRTLAILWMPASCRTICRDW